MEKESVIGEVLACLVKGDPGAAQERLRASYPFVPMVHRRVGMSERRKLRLFLRDGIVDRYPGQRLDYPPLLRTISLFLPEEFPLHPNWRMCSCHQAYWELISTIDHQLPVTRGGCDEDDNLVTPSCGTMPSLTGLLKSRVGGSILRAPHQWDGLMQGFLDLTEVRPSILSNSYVKSWYRNTQSNVALLNH